MLSVKAQRLRSNLHRGGSRSDLESVAMFTSHVYRSELGGKLRATFNWELRRRRNRCGH